VNTAPDNRLPVHIFALTNPIAPRPDAPTCMA